MATRHAAPVAALKSLARGVVPAGGPLFLPLACSVAAQIEALPPNEFLRDPTKLSIGLAALHKAIESDGIVCFAPSGAEAEALGAETDASRYPPRLMTRPAAGEELDDALLKAFTKGARIAAAVEATRRLAATSHGEMALVAALTGPATLAEQLAGERFLHSVRSAGDEPIPLLDFASRAIVALTRAFAEAGAQMVLLVEEGPAIALDSAVLAWRGCVTPFVNVARFHRVAAAVVVGVPDANVARPYLQAVPRGVIACAREAIDWRAEGGFSGLALDPAEDAWTAARPRGAVITTCAEVPVDRPIASLRDASSALMAAIGAR